MRIHVIKGKEKFMKLKYSFFIGLLLLFLFAYNSSVVHAENEYSLNGKEYVLIENGIGYTDPGVLFNGELYEVTPSITITESTTAGDYTINYVINDSTTLYRYVKVIYGYDNNNLYLFTQNNILLDGNYTITDTISTIDGGFIILASGSIIKYDRNFQEEWSKDEQLGYAKIVYNPESDNYVILTRDHLLSINEQGDILFDKFIDGFNEKIMLVDDGYIVTGNYSPFVEKFNFNGDFGWKKGISGYATSMIEDNNNYLVISTEDKLYKLKPDGTYVFNYDNTKYGVEILLVNQLEDGTYLIIGYNPNKDLVLIKLDQDGAVIQENSVSLINISSYSLFQFNLLKLIKAHDNYYYILGSDFNLIRFDENLKIENYRNYNNNSYSEANFYYNYVSFTSELYVPIEYSELLKENANEYYLIFSNTILDCNSEVIKFYDFNVNLNLTGFNDKTTTNLSNFTGSEDLKFEDSYTLDQLTDLNKNAFGVKSIVYKFTKDDTEIILSRNITIKKFNFIPYIIGGIIVIFLPINVILAYKNRKKLSLKKNIVGINDSEK